MEVKAAMMKGKGVKEKNGKGTQTLRGETVDHQRNENAKDDGGGKAESTVSRERQK